MDSPENTQQETQSLKTEDLIADTFDQLEAESGGDDIPETEIDFEEEDGHESAEVETKAEEVEEKEEEVAELKEEIEAAQESEFNEPAPERWEQGMQDYYNKLDPAGKEIFLNKLYKPMQRSYTQATQELAEMRGQIKPVLSAMQTYTEDFKRMGVDPAEAFRTQMAWANHIHKVGAEQGLADMANAYGVNQKTAQTGGQEQYLTPTERAFKEQITALQQQVSGQAQTAQQQTEQQRQQAEDAQRSEIQTNLTTFINEKTDDGKLAHPHVEKVASNIAGIIRGGLISKTDDYGNPVAIRDQLAQAYSMACNLDPSIRTPQVDKRQAERVERTNGVQVVTKTPAGQVSAENDLPIDKFIEKTWEKMNRQSA